MEKNDLDSFEAKRVGVQKKERNFFFAKLSVATLFILLVLLYFVTPISKIRNPEIEGTRFLDNQTILKYGKVDEGTFLFRLNKKSLTKLLNSHPLIMDANVSLTPISLKITYEELIAAFKYDDKIYLSSGEELTKDLLDDPLVGPLIAEEVLNLPSLYPQKKKPTLEDLKVIAPHFKNMDEKLKKLTTLLYFEGDSFNVYHALVYDKDLDLYFDFTLLEDNVTFYLDATKIEAFLKTFKALPDVSLVINNKRKKKRINSTDYDIINVLGTEDKQFKLWEGQ